MATPNHKLDWGRRTRPLAVALRRARDIGDRALSLHLSGNIQDTNSHWGEFMGLRETLPWVSLQLFTRETA